jgi:hypothetical protein
MKGYYQFIDGAWFPMFGQLREVRLVHVVDGTRRYAVLARSIKYVDAQGREHIAKHGMETDGGSKPRLVWWIFGHPFDAVYLPAYVVHDAGCYAAAEVFHGTGQIEGNRELGWAMRRAADRTFIEGVGHLGGSLARRRSYWRAVRFGAWWALR